MTKPAEPQLMAKAILLIRLMVGIVFLVEDILKFLYPEGLGAGRFAKIGIPIPGVMGPFVAGVESVCGALVLLGLVTRMAAIPLLVDVSVAIISTKVPVLLGHGLWGFAFRASRPSCENELTAVPHATVTFACRYEGMWVFDDARVGLLSPRRPDAYGDHFGAYSPGSASMVATPSQPT